MKYIYQTILVIVFAFWASTGLFAHSFEANGIYYKITSYNSTYPTVEVTYKGTYFDSYTEYSGRVSIPSYVSYNGKRYYVTSIGSDAFRDCTGLTNVSIPNSVTSIESAAFNYCKSLTSITIPNSVTTIGDYAFWSCYGLTSVTIPNGLVNIKHHAFYECNNLSFISIPESVIFIEQSAFEGTAWYNNQPNGLVYAGKVLYKYKGELEKGTEIVIKDGTKGIANNTFRDCNNLTSIIIPESVTSIGRDAFAGTAWYNNQPDGMVYAGKVLYKYKGDLVGESNITIKDGTTGIGDEAFYRYSAIESIDIPNSVLTIGNSAFEGCGSLKSITIPSSVTTIGNRAFCEIQFESVTIGSGVLSVGNHAFGKYPYGENKPTKIIWLTNTPPSGYINAEGKINYVANEQYVSFDNKVIYPFLSSIFEAGGIKYVPVNPSDRTCDAIDCSYDNLTTSLKIGKSVSYMGIDMVVKKLQPYICYQNTNIKDVVLEHEGEVPQYAFKGCTGLENIIISNDGNISQYAFKGCTRLENITISNNGDISQYAFDECTGLKTINLQNKGLVRDATFQGCTLLEKVTFGKNISGVGRYAFKGCSSLLSIDLPDNVQSIGAYAFSNCSSISKAKIGAGIQSLEANIFSDCQLLSEVTIGKNVKNIGPNAFNGCTSLSCITIPQSVNSIESYALRGCTQLKTIIFEEGDNELSLNNNVFTDDPLDSVYIGRNLSYSAYSSDGYSPFYRISTLRSIHISDKETEISNYEFYGCTNLQNVQIGDGVISIGDWAFSGCSSLDFFAFGRSVKTIGQEAFSDCTAMTRLISRAATPPTCGSQALDDINKWNCTLSVPTGATTAYQQAEQWKEFFFINNDMTGISRLTNTNVAPNHIYELNGRKLKEPSKGINIIGGKKVVVK